MKPASSQFSVYWRPAISFLEERSSVLRKLEEAGLLRSFRFKDEVVTVRLGDLSHEMRIAVDHLDINLRTESPDVERVSKAVEIVWNTLKPESARIPNVLIQWLDPVDDVGYDAVRRIAAERALTSDDGFPPTDFAISMDGEIADPPGIYQAEFGFVDSQEARDRLRRAYGRFAGSPTDSYIAPDKVLPDVAFFCDSRWVFHSLEVAADTEIVTFWQEFCEIASSFVGDLKMQLRGETE